MGKANIARGEKWNRVRDEAVFYKKQEEINWLDSQPAIVADIEEYKESKKTKSKKEK